MTVLDALEWASRHSDAWHDGSRDDCEHCQEMIKTFGPMPSVEEIRDASAKLSTMNQQLYGRPKIDVADRWEVWERDDFRCRRCGGRKFLSIDHVVPLAAGGENKIDNYQTLCNACNSSKGARL